MSIDLRDYWSSIDKIEASEAEQQLLSCRHNLIMCLLSQGKLPCDRIGDAKRLLFQKQQELLDEIVSA